MDISTLLPYIREYGYFALYIILWIGFFGFPVPNEVIVMTSGLIGSRSLLEPFFTFIVTYLGVISSLTTLFFLGRFENKVKKGRFKSEKILKAKEMIRKHGAFSLVISYYLPTVRHLIPFILGTDNFSYRKFALYSYTNALVWTTIYYSLGFWFGEHIHEIGEIVYRYGLYTLIILATIFIIFMLVRKVKRNQPSN
ncbi:DedA family protein [Bacillus sp. Marseille-P3661]|uniref:DedA family protein n=1 Tax=Bacillus sp. Marseille-P3661 TaxID=1936234 RepID=UPI000C820276|nr:DedA family protein [Bacillus sp. Marseille-P3661]